MREHESGGQKRETESERRWFGAEERECVFIFGVSPQAVSVRTQRFSLSSDNFIQTKNQLRSFMTVLENDRSETDR